MTAWSLEQAPLDMWAGVRAQAPDTDDRQTRHQRGYVRLPWSLGDTGNAGDLVRAWVCCDPACAGVELGEHVLDINHGCCDVKRFVGQRRLEHGRHRVGLGTVHFTGHHHGPYTAYWQPGGAA